MLEFVEVAFDQIALAIEAAVDASLDQAASRRRDMGLGAARPDQLEQRVGIVAAIGNNMRQFRPAKR